MKNLILTTLVISVLFSLFFTSTVRLQQATQEVEVQNSLDRLCKRLVLVVNREGPEDKKEYNKELELDLDLLDLEIEKGLTNTGKVLKEEGLKLKLVVIGEKMYIKKGENAWLLKYVRKGTKIFNVTEGTSREWGEKNGVKESQHKEIEALVLEQVSAEIAAVSSKGKVQRLKKETYYREDVVGGVTLYLLYKKPTALSLLPTEDMQEYMLGKYTFKE